MEQRDYEYWLAGQDLIGVQPLRRLLALYGSAERIFRALHINPRKYGGRKP